ncbi:MAG TPA: carboxypeptidase-like regulatory domain-containing protein [Thermoanaerobaculia bacterium]|nr:carboxypeptidase-like regulatory domain-containing protein [Thermoanaerobaculia bacterium]
MRTAAVALSLFALLFPTASAVADIEITGRVLDAKGNAVKANVALVAIPSAAEARTLQLEGRLVAEPLLESSCERDGRFRLIAKEGGMLRVLVRAERTMPYAFDLVPLLSDIELPPLRIEPSETLRVRVLGVDGQPRVGARVRAWPVNERTRADAWRIDERMAVTETSGLATFARARNERLHVSAIGNDTPEVRAIAEAASIELRLPRGCARPLDVRNANGSPALAWVAGDHWTLGVTNEDGLFTVDAPCDAPMRVLAETADGAVARATLAPLENATPATLTLQPQERVSGRVLDAETRAAIANALLWSSDDPARFVRSDARGNYTIARAGELRAAASGHLPRAERVASSGPTFALQPTALLSGSVVDAQGRGIGGVAVEIDEWSGDAVIRFRPRAEGLASRTITRANGAFRVEVLPRRAHTLKATRDGFAPATLIVPDKLAPFTSRSGLQLVLDEGRSAFGRIIDDETGEPVASAELRLVRATPKSNLPKFLRGVDDSEAEEWRAFANGDGTFRFEHLPTATFELIAHANGFAERTISGITIEHSTDIGDVALTKGVTLEGTVVDRRGRAIDGATVAVHPPSVAGISGDAALRFAAGEARETRTSNEGRFTVDSLTPGATFDVTARAPGFVTRTIARLELPASEPLQIVLETAARVSGRVVTETGEPVPNATISVRPADAALPAGLSGTTTSSDAEGSYELLNLAAGKLALAAAAKGYIAGDTRIVDVADGQVLDHIDLQLQRGATIEGVVLTAGGTPATSARVSLLSKRSMHTMLALEVTGFARTDGDGRFRLEGVPLGAQSVSADQDGFLRAQRELTIQPGINRLDLRLGEGSAVSGHVTDAGGRPIAGAAVSLLTAGPGIAREEMSDPGGTFRFAGLETGRYQLTARKDGFSSARQDVEIAARPLDGIELRLSEGGGVISGRIIGANAQELAQVRISAVKRPLDSLDAMREGHVNGDAYRIEGIYSGEWRISARLANGRQAQKIVQVSDASQTTQLDLDLTQGLTLSGTVRNEGQPIGNAVVEVQGTTAEPVANTVTDSAGRFRIEGLAPGAVKVIVQIASRGLRHEENVALSGSIDVNIEVH